ncbi:unnamed protein product [Rhizophagus irregularis]|nr:unnamed protein product [Rhizophagus irregularis]
MNFTYLNNHSNIIPAELIPEYVKLFQTIYDNDISKVGEMSQYLVFAVCDKLNMTPFMWACFRGHNELAIKILDIVTSQYEPKKNIELFNEGNNTNIINNYEVIDNDDECEDYSGDFGYEHQGSYNQPQSIFLKTKIMTQNPSILSPYHYFKNNGGLLNTSLILGNNTFNVYNTYSTYRYGVRSLITLMTGYALIKTHRLGNTLTTVDWNSRIRRCSNHCSTTR